MVNASKWLPKGVLPWILERSKRPELVRLRHNRALVRELARNLVESKKKEAKEGVLRGDIMSLLGLSNAISGESAGQLIARSQSDPVLRRNRTGD